MIQTVYSKKVNIKFSTRFTSLYYDLPISHGHIIRNLKTEPEPIRNLKTEPEPNRKNKTETGLKVTKNQMVPIFLNPKNRNRTETKPRTERASEYFENLKFNIYKI